MKPEATYRDAAPSGLLPLCGLLLFLFGFLMLTMPRWIYEGDPIAMRAATICLLTTGNLDVPADYALSFGERGQFFAEHPRTASGTPSTVS